MTAQGNELAVSPYELKRLSEELGLIPDEECRKAILRYDAELEFRFRRGLTNDK